MVMSRLHNRLLIVLGITALLVTGQARPALSQEKLAPGETSKIAEEAFIYGFPMVMNYAIFYEYFVDEVGPRYKAPPNQLYNTARVYTPQDTAIVTPNSDTPYSLMSVWNWGNSPSSALCCRWQVWSVSVRCACRFRRRVRPAMQLDQWQPSRVRPARGCGLEQDRARTRRPSMRAVSFGPGIDRRTGGGDRFQVQFPFPISR
jgi:hypothetical protein